MLTSTLLRQRPVRVPSLQPPEARERHDGRSRSALPSTCKAARHSQDRRDLRAWLEERGAEHAAPENPRGDRGDAAPDGSAVRNVGGRSPQHAHRRDRRAGEAGARTDGGQTSAVDVRRVPEGGRCGAARQQPQAAGRSDRRAVQAAAGLDRRLAQAESRRRVGARNGSQEVPGRRGVGAVADPDRH
eukprot:3077524-Rhodomonas_salina.1